MSIALNTRRLASSTASGRLTAAAIERPLPNPKEQLRATRALVRHFALAFAGAVALIYAAAASGLPV
jgi:hypothetical protein